MPEKTAKRDLLLRFGDVGYLRLASTGETDPEEILDMLRRVCRVPVTCEVQEPSRFGPPAGTLPERVAAALERDASIYCTVLDVEHRCEMPDDTLAIWYEFLRVEVRLEDRGNPRTTYGSLGGVHLPSLHLGRDVEFTFASAEGPVAKHGRTRVAYTFTATHAPPLKPEEQEATTDG